MKGALQLEKKQPKRHPFIKPTNLIIMLKADINFILELFSEILFRNIMSVIKSMGTKHGLQNHVDLTCFH